uniref:succinate dehydrogenase subunit 4 n=1 Tax=Cystoclonium purpureum f. stellatum TaxID=3024809 RepID=UPI0023F40648|nr:succinate dehydrogenase subunit 4 [Cystoclonium purpureum f. stellatum]WDY85189.1 succinate dehydrogenase subunit 4 [Cystoclonium purpureum f. stellatum]
MVFNFEWLILRSTALFIIIGLFFDIEVILLIIGFLFVHINIGICMIIYDYVHVKKIKYIFLWLVCISSIEVSKYILELFF